MIKRNLVLALPVVILFSCSGDNLKEEIVDKYPSGAPKKIEYYSVSGSNKNLAKEVRFYENGEKSMEGEFKNGLKSGHWTTWFENGNKQSEGNYKDGFREGAGPVWNEDGSRLYEGYYKHDKPDSIWTFYKAGGRILKKVTFKDGKKISEEDK
ncbi:MAG: hypothetical protein NTW49_07990 [Bacteroidia bacterium]|nr:hypothetical protein [Bacteroidia bacterium]